MVQDFSFVACDIVGHSGEPDLQRQIDRIRGLNVIVDEVLTSASPGTTVWASGGDGGHVAISNPNWLDTALDLICRLRDWSISNGVRRANNSWATPPSAYEESASVDSQSVIPTRSSPP